MTTTSVLVRVVSLEFYRLNTGFFLVVTGICFGFMRDVEHIALAQFFISAQWPIAIPVLAWLLYALKIMLFNKRVLRQDENIFLYSLRLYTPVEIITSLTITISLQLIPVFGYVTFLLLMSLKNGTTFPSLVIVLSVPVLMLLLVFIMVNDLKHGIQEGKTGWIKQWVDKRIARSHFVMSLEWLVRREPLALLGVKLFSYALLFGITQLYAFERYDIRLITIGTCIVFLSQALLVYHLHRFENKYLAIYRNLPFPILKRINQFALVAIVLCLPETGLLLSRMTSYFSVSAVSQTVIMGWSIWILLYGMLYSRDWAPEPLLRITFLLMVIMMMLILFKLPSIMIIAINLVAGIILTRKYYYRFEYLVKE